MQMIKSSIICWSFFVLACLACPGKELTEFTVAAYNLENLFDVDGPTRHASGQIAGSEQRE